MQLKLSYKPAHISAAVFLLVIFLMPILIFAVPKSKFLEDENKERADFPALNMRTVFDKSFMQDFEDYAADAFPLRSDWIGLQTRVLLALGQKEVNGIYILPDRLLPHLEEPDPQTIVHSVQAINEFSTRFSGTTYLMLIPTATEIYRSELPTGASALQEKEIIDQVSSQVKNVTTIDVYSSLTANRDSNIYYRSDHHWTSRGAYLGYSALGSQLGFTAVPMDLFNVEHASHNFRGSSYSKVIYSGVEADTIDLYEYPAGPKVTNVSIFDGREWSSHDGLYFREYLTQKDQYSVFLGQNQPIVTIRTDAPNENRLLIFKDSYAHSLAPFLALHYSEITLVDLRYLRQSFENYVDLSRYNQALFCYNMKNFTEEDVIRMVNLSK
ncbi:MAG: DHHW family protein [Candidatus Merdivicinus sp.]